MPVCVEIASPEAIEYRDKAVGYGQAYQLSGEMFEVKILKSLPEHELFEGKKEDCWLKKSWVEDQEYMLLVSENNIIPNSEIIVKRVWNGVTR